MATYFEWLDSYSVGLPQFDDAHKRLIVIINAVCGACMENRPVDDLTDSIIELIRYARHHFREEEEWMQSVNFPGLTAHRAKHDVLFDRVLHHTRDYFRGRIAKGEFTEFLVDWLLSHILGEDMRYREHNEERLAAQAAAEAS